MTASVHDVVVVGGGPAGLSAAYELVRAGVTPVVLEKTPAVGDVWRHHYDGLRLNTGRYFSSLPGTTFPKAAGAWPTRDDLVNVLETFPQRGGFNVQTGVDVGAIDYDARADLWTVTTTAGVRYVARSIVVATGTARIPVMPQWDGIDQYTGTLLHSSTFKHAAQYAGKKVLVVGSGNSAAEIASRLSAYASEVVLSIRTPPHILPKRVLGIPLAGLGVLMRRWPTALSDRVLALLQRVYVGDLSAYGIPGPRAAVSVKFNRTHVTPTLYPGFAKDIRQGKIRIVGPVHHIDANHVHVWKTIGDAQQTNGQVDTLAPDVIVAGTGFRTGIASLVNIAGVTDASDIPVVTGATDNPRAPRLYFIGQSNPLSGQLREIGLEAPLIARRVQQVLQQRSQASHDGVTVAA